MNFFDIFLLRKTLAMAQIADIVISESQNPWIYVKDELTSFSCYPGHQRIHAVKVVLCDISAEEKENILSFFRIEFVFISFEGCRIRVRI